MNHRLPSSLEYSDAPSVPLASTLLEHILKPLHFTYSSCTTGARYSTETEAKIRSGPSHRRWQDFVALQGGISAPKSNYVLYIYMFVYHKHPGFKEIARTVTSNILTSFLFQYVVSVHDIYMISMRCTFFYGARSQNGNWLKVLKEISIYSISDTPNSSGDRCLIVKLPSINNAITSSLVVDCKLHSVIISKDYLHRL